MSDLVDDLRSVQYFFHEKGDPTRDSQGWEEVQKCCPRIARAYTAWQDAEAFFGFSIEQALKEIE